MSANISSTKLATLKSLIQQWAQDAGFAAVGFSDTDTSAHIERLNQWLSKDYHGEMSFMQSNHELRAEPSKLQQDALTAISFRKEYRHDSETLLEQLSNKAQAYIARYALGKDYHKLMRKRLAAIANKIEAFAELNLNQRAFVDSAPVLERALAEKAGLGWIGKNTMLINPQAGSWFFLGEILTNLKIPLDKVEPQTHCGSCTSCLTSCPTNSFVGANILDSRRCISYLTIELKTAIPDDLRDGIGNRVFGCDDCQLVCPWNKFSPSSPVAEFKPRHGLDDSSLLELFQWNEETFLKRTEGSAIRRIGYIRWQRNLAIGLGNSDNPNAIDALRKRRRETDNAMLIEHIDWAINKLMRSSQQ